MPETMPVDLLDISSNTDIIEVSTDWDATLGQSKYDFNSRTFPSDLGSGYNGHWMVLNINVSEQSNFGNVTRKGGMTRNEQMLNWTELPDTEKSKTDALRFSIDGSYTGKAGSMSTPGATVSLLDNQFNIPIVNRERFTRRIVESIALYMPNSELTFSDAHDFDNISLTKFGAAAASGLAKFALSGAVATFLGAKVGTAAGALAGQIFDSAGQVAGGLFQIMGTPINPKVEVLFSNTFQREFVFDFIFSPSSEKESEDIRNIIRTIRFHGAPETQPGLADTFFWVPPSEFDITFYYKDANGAVQENKKIPRINTCVLKQVDVSYSPTGAYSTFKNGHPVQIRMQLRFIETEVVHKLRVMQGF